MVPPKSLLQLPCQILDESVLTVLLFLGKTLFRIDIKLRPASTTVPCAGDARIFIFPSFYQMNLLLLPKAIGEPNESLNMLINNI